MRQGIWINVLIFSFCYELYDKQIRHIIIFLSLRAGGILPCEQRLHFRGMRRRAKSSLCRQPFNFISCMRKIRHAIRKQLVRQICVSFAGIKIAKTTCEQLSSSFCFVFLLCPSGFKYFSRKISSDRLLRKHYATCINCSMSCLI